MDTGVFLSLAERSRLQSLPADISHENVVEFFTLTPEDLAATNRPGRANLDRLGFALTLCALRFLGHVPVDITEVPDHVLRFVAEQVGCRPVVVGYASRAQTRGRHIALALHHLGMRRLSRDDTERLRSWMLVEAGAHQSKVVLLDGACKRLFRLRVLRPGLTILERMVTAARQQAEEHVVDALQATILPIEPLLDAALEVDAELGGTRVAWLRERPRTNSPAAINSMLDKHQWLVDVGAAAWAVSGVHPNRLRYLASLGRTTGAQALQRMPARRRYPILIAFLRQSLIDITDELLDMVGQCLADTRARARRALKEHQRGVVAAQEEVIRAFEAIGSVMLESDVAPGDLRAKLLAAVPAEDIARLVDVCRGSGRPMDSEGLDFLRSRYSYIRQFSARFITQMRVHSADDQGPVMKAIGALVAANEAPGGRLPDDAPIEFVPKRWRPFVVGEHGVDRAYYELCALWSLRDALRAGDVHVANSRRYAQPDTYLLPASEWDREREEITQRLGVDLDVASQLDRLEVTLHELSAGVSRAVEDGSLRIEDGSLVVPPLEGVPRSPRLQDLEKRVTDLLPRVELGELLVEVDRWTDFTRELFHESSEARPSEKVAVHVYSAILAQASNMGFTGMGRIANVTFEQLHWASAWHLREQTLKAASDAVVDFQYRLPLSRSWGAGTLSSSDGQRFPVSGSVRSARALPRYFGYGRGVTFYSWTSDQFSQYGVKVIPATSRDATYVLDALLDNQTELDIIEHTTDTHGYTDLVFALFGLLGLRFAPRIRDLASSRLYQPRGVALSLPEGVAVAGRADTRAITEHWDAMLRIAGSLKTGHVSASLLLSKLQAQPPRGVVRGLLEYGRLCKTEHGLRYLGDEDYRRRIGAQLNKGEAIHALRRFLVFGDLGRLRGRDQEALMNQASCLNLVSNAVTTWNTVYMDRAIKALRAAGHEVRDEDVAHLSPARHEHINPFGKYRFDRLPPRGRFRPLQPMA